ncbi:MAG: ImmA/IrrE family metallo-endopeptidase [Promethearchaeota archaeon]
MKLEKIIEKENWKELLKLVFESLIHYEIHHTCFPSNLMAEKSEGIYYGITATDKKRVYINKELSFTEKRYTIMHELIHVISDIRGEKEISENKINELVFKMYKKLYQNE